MFIPDRKARSRGFVWFFSLLAYFSQLELDDGKLILLLDEPGLNLHATAQGDLLHFIDERLAPTHQVIYSTHSPFVVEAGHLERVRTVTDIPDEGTKVSAEVYRTDRETVFPLQAALGYDLAQTLFVGPDNLLVEGPSDLIYIQLLTQAMRAQGREGLSDRWVVVPVGGADKLATFVSLLGGNQLNVRGADGREQEGSAANQQPPRARTPHGEGRHPDRRVHWQQ